MTEIRVPEVHLRRTRVHNSFKRAPVPHQIISREKCILCRMDKFKKYYVRKLGIPMENMVRFSRDLKRSTSHYLETSASDGDILTVNLSFIQNIQKYITRGEVDEVNLRAIDAHFKTCIHKGVRTKKLHINTKIDDIILEALREGSIYEQGDDGTRTLSDKTVHTLEKLKRIGNLCLSEYYKMDRGK